MTICNFCGADIPKEKIEEFKSKFKAQESEIRKEIEKNFKERIETEKEKSEEKLKQQKELFDDFQKRLEKNYEEDRLRMSKDFEKRVEERLKNKDEEISLVKSKLEKADAEKGKIEEKIEEKYKQKINEFKEKVDTAVSKKQEKEEEINELRTKLQEKDEKVAKLKKDSFESTERLKSEYEEKIRKLENKTSSELGEEGQAEVLDILNRAFRGDDIKETKRGKLGSDIFHKVFNNGEEIGLIIYEVKNHSDWKNEFISQIKEDKTRHSANYAILVSNVFPSKEKIISEKEGIIIVHPTKVAIIAREIRNFLIETHKAKLSGEEIEEKIKILQEYLTSQEYKNLLSDLLNSIRELRDIRDKEKLSHERHWSEEEKLNNKIYEKTGKIHTKIGSIIESRLEKVFAIVPNKKKKKSKNN